MKYIFYLILITIIYSKSFSQEARVYSQTYPNAKEIHMGLAYLGDSLSTKFILVNTTGNRYYLQPIFPTFGIFRHPEERNMDEFNLFDNDNFVSTVGGDFDNTGELDILYKGFDNDPFYNVGMKLAKMALGMAKDSGLTEIAVLDTFDLMAKTTDKYIDSWYDKFDFDTVFVNTNNPPIFKWAIENVWTENLEVISEKDTLLRNSTLDDEFQSSGFALPKILNAYDSPVYSNISYSPKNIGIDSALFFVEFRPNPNNDAVLDTADILFIGIGAEYEIAIVSSDNEFSNDTIFVGELLRGGTITDQLVLRNNGNLPFGVESFSLLDESGQETEDLEITGAFFLGKDYLEENETGSLRYRLSNNAIGNFTYRIRLRSDAVSRGIKGVPGDKLNTNIYIVGSSKEAKAALPADTLDFGNVVLNSAECPSIRDSVIVIANNGSYPLEIIDIYTVPEFPRSKFYFSRNNFEIAANSFDTLTVYFDANDSEYKNYSANMKLIYRKSVVLDTLEMELLAASVAPITANIILPEEINIKPGSDFLFPIRINTIDTELSPLVFAKSFSADLIIDSPDLIDLENRLVQNTASENSFISISEESEGHYKIEIDNNNEYFHNEDILVNLLFRAYLGKKAFTSISLNNVRFGDDGCGDVLKIEEVNSSVMYIDSVCALEYKIRTLESSLLGISSVYPNPASNELTSIIKLWNNEKIILKIFDNYGRVIKEVLSQELPEGIYEFNLPVAELNSGQYFLLLEMGAFRQTKPFLIYK